MEQLKEWWNKFYGWFKQLPLWQRIALVATPLVLTASLLFIAYFNTPHYSVLFSNLDPDTLQRVEYTLSRLGIDYKVDLKTGTVEVPSDQVDRLRIYLAEQGIISPEKKVGFEIFDKQSFTVSDFVEHVNYIRALEGELEKTISSIDAIEDAKVNIALPRQSIFARPEEEAKASVLIKLKPGAQLTPEQIKAIRDLVAASVVGLKPQNVVIVDQYGRDLTALLDENNSLVGLATNQIKLKLEYEKKLQREIENILSSVVGYGNAKVKVSLYLDFSQTQEKDYEVNPDQTAIVSQQKEKTEKRAVQPLGAPGTESNIPPGKGRKNAEALIETSRKSITNYEVSYIQRLINDPTIKVKKIAVGVILNSAVKGVNPEKIKKFLISSLGLNPKRGDTVSVVEIPFKGKEEISQVFAKETHSKLERRYIYFAAIGLTIVLILLTGLLYWWHKRRKEEEEFEEMALYGSMLGAPSGAAAVTEKAEESLIKKLSNLSKENPELYKKILLKWLKNEK